MGCGGGIHELFRIHGNGCDSRRSGNDSYYQDTQEKIILIKRLYAEGKINRESYYSLKDSAYNGNLSFDYLMEIKENSSGHDPVPKEKQSNKNTSSNNYKDKIKQLQNSKGKVESIKSKIHERLHEMLQERQKIEEMAESMVSSSEDAARDFIEKKLDLEENIQTLKKREQELNNQIDEIDKTIKVIDTKMLDYEAVKLQEELENLKQNI